MNARRRLMCAVLLLTWTGATEQPAGQTVPRPLVRLVATGGTISNLGGARLTATELIDRLPEVHRHAQVEAEQFSNVASSSLTLDQWLTLARRLDELFRTRDDLDGVVVTTGTDTLEEIAFFLHLTVRSERPVVVVGSMRRPRSSGYDGSANLLQAFRVAAAPQSRGRGVLVVLNDTIHSARDVAKTDAHRPDAFSSRHGALGVVDDDQVTFRRNVATRHTLASEFDLTDIDALPRVDVLLSYQAAPGDLVHAAVAGGAQGLVVAATGAGSTSPAQRSAIEEVIAAGVPVVVTTRTGGGRVVPQARRSGSGAEADASRGRAFRIAGQDHSPVKARVLLMLALSQTRNPAEIRRMFGEY